MFKMIQKTILATVLSMACLATMPAIAGDTLNTEAIKGLIVGNTVQEKNLKWGYERKFYFDADGTFRRVDENGNKDKGTWEFEKDGVLCLQRVKLHCWRLLPKGDGSYEVSGRGRGTEAPRKIWRIVPGNPDKL